VVQFDKEASQTRVCAAQRARRIARLARSFAAQRTLAQDDKQTAQLPDAGAGSEYHERAVTEITEGS